MADTERKTLCPAESGLGEQKVQPLLEAQRFAGPEEPLPPLGLVSLKAGLVVDPFATVVNKS